MSPPLLSCLIFLSPPLVSSSCPGVIVNFLPAFGAIDKKSKLFDDKLYWEVSNTRLHLVQTNSHLEKLEKLEKFGC